MLVTYTHDNIAQTFLLACLLARDSLKESFQHGIQVRELLGALRCIVRRMHAIVARHGSFLE